MVRNIKEYQMKGGGRHTCLVNPGQLQGSAEIRGLRHELPAIDVSALPLARGRAERSLKRVPVYLIGWATHSHLLYASKYMLCTRANVFAFAYSHYCSRVSFPCHAPTS